MAPLAKAFKDEGWQVSGSDHRGVYPPMSDYLKNNNLQYVEGYSENNLKKETDLVIVGRSALMVDPRNPEYFRARLLKIPTISYPEAIAKYLIKKESIVVAGTYGKTTVTALVSWILKKAGKDPSFMIGGQPLNFPDGVCLNNSSFSVVEGDETPDLFPNDPPKFLFYRPKYLLLTATHWDHPEIFPSKKEYLSAFSKLMKLIPEDGKLIYNLDNVDPKPVKEFKGEKISYSFSDHKADWFVNDSLKKSENTELHFNKLLKINTVLLGKANWENICGALALCSSLGVDQKSLISGVETFVGVKTRLEFLGRHADKYFYWDFAQHPEKVKASLEALRDHYSKNRIICVFDPSATILKYKESLNWFTAAFSCANIVLLNRTSFMKEIKKNDRVKGQDLVEAIRRGNPEVSLVVYCPLKSQINDFLQTKTSKDDVIVFMSSGGIEFTKLIEENVSYFKKLKD